MSSLFRRAVWAGIALRMDDGTLYVVEVDRCIDAELTIDVEKRETTWDNPGATFRTFEPGDMHVDVRVRGLGRHVERMRPDMGADVQPTPAIEPAFKEVEGG